MEVTNMRATYVEDKNRRLCAKQREAYLYVLRKKYEPLFTVKFR